MTMTLRPAAERGHADHGWLKSAHSFSFAGYHDPAHMGFRSLRVINEDRVAPGGGFPPHAHADMEIVTYVLDGALRHEDSLGNGAVIRPGEAQRMSAGAGIRHSEYNASTADPVHFLQIWLLPNACGVPAGYEQRALPPVAPGESRFDTVAAPHGGDGVTMRADAIIRRAVLAPAGLLDLAVTPGAHLWLQIARGEASANGQALTAGDGLAISGTDRLTLTSAGGGELLVFELA